MIKFLIDIYNQFLALFPPELHFLISLIIVIAVGLALLRLIRKNLWWILLLLILFPTLIPVFRKIVIKIFAFLASLVK
jgi:hypothetical protein